MTQPGETVQAHGVNIMGPFNVPSTVPYHASQMYAHNVVAFVRNLIHDGKLELNLEDRKAESRSSVHVKEIELDMELGEKHFSEAALGRRR